MPSIIEVDTIKNKTGTQNTVLSTDGSGNNTLNANTIKDGSATKTLATLSSSAVTLHSDVSFPSDHVVQTNYTTYVWSGGDSTGVNGIEINQAFGTIHTFVPKYNNTKILFIMQLPEVLTQSNNFGMGFCVTTNSGLTAGQGNNDPEGSHSATIYRDYKQREYPGVSTPYTSITFKTISCTAGTTYYIAPIISNVEANTSDIYANWSGTNSMVQTQLLIEISP